MFNTTRLTTVILSTMAALSPLAMTGCNRSPSPEATLANKTPITPVTVEVRPDGLAYLPGAPTPFTGDAITPYPDKDSWKLKLREPYSNGKRHGEVTELYKDGKIKTQRTYDKGSPKWAKSFHKNGQLKFQLNLNAADKAEGPYTRYYESGKVCAQATFDEQERWHKDFKEWKEDGSEHSHYVFENGKLVKIVFETEEAKTARIAKGVELDK